MNRKLLLIFAVAIVAMTQLVSCKKEILPPMADKIVSVIYQNNIKGVTIYRSNVLERGGEEFVIDDQVLGLILAPNDIAYYDLEKAKGCRQRGTWLDIYYE